MKSMITTVNFLCLIGVGVYYPQLGVMLFTLWSFYLYVSIGRFWMRVKELKLDDCGRLGINGLMIHMCLRQGLSQDLIFISYL